MVLTESDGLRMASGESVRRSACGKQHADKHSLPVICEEGRGCTKGLISGCSSYHSKKGDSSSLVTRKTSFSARTMQSW